MWTHDENGVMQEDTSRAVSGAKPSARGQATACMHSGYICSLLDEIEKAED